MLRGVISVPKLLPSIVGATVYTVWLYSDCYAHEVIPKMCRWSGIRWRVSVFRDIFPADQWFLLCLFVCCTIYKHAFLPTFSKVCALSTSQTHRVDVCTGHCLALIHLADMTLPQHSMIGLVTCLNGTNQKICQAFLASSCFCTCHKENIRNVFHIVFLTGRKVNG